MDSHAQNLVWGKRGGTTTDGGGSRFNATSSRKKKKSCSFNSILRKKRKKSFHSKGEEKTGPEGIDHRISGRNRGSNHKSSADRCKAPRYRKDGETLSWRIGWSRGRFVRKKQLLNAEGERRESTKCERNGDQQTTDAVNKGTALRALEGEGKRQKKKKHRKPEKKRSRTPLTQRLPKPGRRNGRKIGKSRPGQGREGRKGRRLGDHRQKV